MVPVLRIWQYFIYSGNIMPRSKKYPNPDRFLILLLHHAKLSTSVLLIRRVSYRAAKGEAKRRGKKNAVSSSPLQCWSIPENTIQLQSVQSCRVPETNQVMHKLSFLGALFTASEQNFESTEAQNHAKHRFFWVERELLRPLSPTSLLSRIS